MGDMVTARWQDSAVKVDTMQVSSKLRRGTAGYFHWCPACEEMHPLPDGWTFDGNLDSPTFAPSFKTESGDQVCHYNLTAGVLIFHGDCTHAMRGISTPLPNLPEHMQDVGREQ